MKRLRKIIFWCHLPIGVLGGVIILIMCVTGVLLTYEKQLTYWADTRNYNGAPTTTEANRLPLETLLAKARESRNTNPASITVRANKSAPAEVSFGREGTVFLNAYSGQVLGEGSKGVRNFFRVVTDWHRWLGAQGENRQIARAITGACNLGFLLLVISGFYLWFPQRLSQKLFRNVLWFRRGLPSKARDFNWHNVIGFWSAVPLFIVVISGVVISYTWAGNLVYRIVGETPPAPRSNQQPGPQKENKDLATNSSANLDTFVASAQQQVSSWQSITIPVAQATGPLLVSVDSGNGGQPQKRTTVTLDRQTGNVTKFEPFSTNSRGRQLRSILRFAHTGEVLGVAGQTIAGLVSLGGVFLVWTGMALGYRRFRAWLSRQSKTSTANYTEPIGSTGD